VSEERPLTQNLEWLEDLAGIVRSFAAREAELKQEYQRRTESAEQRFKTEAQEQHTAQLRNLSETEASFKAEEERLHVRCTGRTARLDAAHMSGLRGVGQKLEELTGRSRYKLQQVVLKATKERDSGTEAAKQRLKEFNAAMDGEEARIEILKERARKTFGAYKDLQPILDQGEVDESALDPGASEDVQLEELRELLDQNDSDLQDFRRAFLPKFFKYVPVGLVMFAVILVHVGIAGGAYRLGWPALVYQIATGTFVGSLIAVAVMHHLGRRHTMAVIGSAADVYSFARHLVKLGRAKSEARHEKRRGLLDADFNVAKESADATWDKAQGEVSVARQQGEDALEEKFQRVVLRHEAVLPAQLERLNQDRDVTIQRIRDETEEFKERLTADIATRDESQNTEYFATWEAMVKEWTETVPNYFSAFASAAETAQELAPPWDSNFSSEWSPAGMYAKTIPFGRLEVDLAAMTDGIPQDERLPLPGRPEFSIPMALSIPWQAGVLFESGSERRGEAIAALNNLVLRIMTGMPPGKANFTIIDPVGLGQNFAGMMQLADFEDSIISSRIWTQSGQIEKRLADLNDHMEKVIQMYLRNEYETITHYNDAAGNIAEKYHFVVVADFPNSFSDIAARRLLNIAASGARCGVYTLIHWDTRQTLPQDFVLDELREKNISFRETGYGFILNDRRIPGVDIVLDSPPTPAIELEITQMVGQAGADSNRVEVPFEHVAPAVADMWTQDTANELRIAIGRSGATKLQYLAIGKGTCQHALFAGKTGSGKSTLFHVLITNLALTCSPEQVEFYLIDFKKGVEFKCYGTFRLPHARVVAIESDREFGLSVLQRVDDELRRRGDMFRKVGAQDIAGYKRAGGKEAIPRSLLMIDEFQEFFVEDDRVAQNASVLLDRIVRQGRAFGIHVLLGSQTLGGAYTLARTTIGQMVIRVALQCNEADSYLILDDTNPAARLLTRPGEGIYNDTAGSLEGNSPFQTVWISDTERDKWLQRVNDKAKESGERYDGPIVFEGNAPSDVVDNYELGQRLAAETIEPTPVRHLWLGAPNSIKGPTAAIMQRQSGSNLLVVGQREEAAQALVMLSLISLGAQIPAGKARYFIIDGSAPDTPERATMERLIASLSLPVRLVRNNEIEEVLTEISGELTRRNDDDTVGESIFLIVHGLQRFKKLRYEEDFSFDSSAPAKPGAQLNELICEGAGVGIHTIITVDTGNNLQRTLSRKAISEFEMRVLFQMSANDSANLIDSPKAANLGLHRALYYNEQEGHIETFRPYAIPASDWLESSVAAVNRLHA
jgi:S-DNA-T family DNA segregation ATPase FtsK/SpoIIIE